MAFNIEQARADLVELQSLAEGGDEAAADAAVKLEAKLSKAVANQPYDAAYQAVPPMKKGLVNIGRGMSDAVTGIGQLGGDILGIDTPGLDAAAQQNEEAGRYLNEQPGGLLGYVAGNVAATLPVGMGAGRVLQTVGQAPKLAPAATGLLKAVTAPVRAAQGAASAIATPAATLAGKLTQGGVVGATYGAAAPTTESRQRVENMAFGGAGGVAGQAVVSAAAPIASKSLSLVEPYIGKAVQRLGNAFATMTRQPTTADVERALTLELKSAGIDWQRVPAELRTQMLARASSAMKLPASMPAASVARATQASGLPVPVSLSSGQISRDPQQQVLEANRLSSQNTTFRDFLANQRRALSANLDELAKRGGGETDVAITGRSLRGATEGKEVAAKAATSALYKQADTEVGATPVTLDPLIELVASRGRQTQQSRVLSTLADEIDNMTRSNAAAVGAPNYRELTASGLNELRKTIRASIGNDPAEIALGKQVLGKIDDIQSGIGGQYVAAKTMRTAQGAEFQNRSLAKDVLAAKAKFSDDPKVRDEYIVSRVLNASEKELDDYKRLLLSSNEKELRKVFGADQDVKAAGVQAFKDLRSTTVASIKDQATDPKSGILSPDRLESAIRKIGDKKLEIILGKSQMSVLNDIRAVAKAVRYDEDLVNRSNTGKVVEQALTDIMSNTPSASMQAIAMVKSLANNIKTGRQASSAMKGAESAVRRSPVTRSSVRDYATTTGRAAGSLLYRDQ